MATSDGNESSVCEEKEIENGDFEPEWRPSPQVNLIIVVLVVLSLMAALDATVLVPALSVIAADLNGSATDTFWAGTSYLLTSAIFQPIIASFSHIFGRQGLLLFALCCFASGSLITCLAKTFSQLLAGRSIQGVGGGGIISLVEIIFTDLVPLRQRPLYFTTIQMAWALGTIGGPTIGGLFAEKSTWRWIFYINFPFCAIGFLLVPWVVRFESNQKSLKEKLALVDWIGGILFITSMTAFLIGITWGGVEYPWTSWKVLFPVLAGLAGIAVTIIWEKFGAREPFIRLTVFQPLSDGSIYLCGFLQGLILFAIGYYVAFYLQSAKMLSPLLTGVGGLALFGGLLPTTIICGFIITGTGHFRWSIWSGWVIIMVGTGLLCLLTPDTSTGQWVGIFLVEGLGQGMILDATMVAAQAAASEADIAHATSMFAFSRSLGMCFGVAVGGTVFENLLSGYLDKAGLSHNIAANAEGYLVQLHQMSDTSEVRHTILNNYARAFQGVFAVLTALAALGGVISLTIQKHSMDKALKSDHVVRPVQPNMPRANWSWFAIASRK